MKTTILGATYSISFAKERDDPALVGSDGYCDPTSHKIMLRERPESDVYALDDQAAYTARVLRHEIVHAFFEECGLTGYSSDEALVEWLAVQIPKIVGTMKEADCL